MKFNFIKKTFLLVAPVILLSSCDFPFFEVTLSVSDNNSYFIGQSYAKYGQGTPILSDSSTISDSILSDSFSFHDCVDPNGESFDITDTFEKIGIYTFKVTYQNKYNAEYKIKVVSGAYVPDELTFVNSDIKTNYAPATGKQKMLVIPINLQPGTITEYGYWNSTNLASINDYYFGSKESTPNGWNSLKTYYETASLGNLNITGMVSDVYSETSSSLTMSAIDADRTYQSLFVLISRAVSWVENHYPNQDWSEYDTNSDGCIDSIHLITNYYAYDWNTPLWPHMYETNNTSGTHTNPVANVYSISAINHVSSARTSIHEQGHIFGLQDYYDYSDSGNSVRDYVGQADMQSHNVMDWNSYSKLSVGWTKPIVVDGKMSSTTVTLRPASLTGDCLLVPVPNTWNGSAFDEYMLMELFTRDGNNKDDWYNWSGALGTGGVRLYHVDSRIYGYNGSDVDANHAGLGGSLVDNVKTSNYEHFIVGANNSYDASSYISVPGFDDFQLLTLIQRGKVNTFSNSSSNKRHYLTREDLFITGSVFTFNDYKSFFTKTSVATTMDDGRTFPYTITFNEVTSSKATITITRN